MSRYQKHSPNNTGRTSVDIGVSTSLELVDKFCYLGDMVSVDGDAVAAVETRIQIGRNKFRQLVPLLTNKDTHTHTQTRKVKPIWIYWSKDTNKDISLTVRGRLYSSCV